MRIAMLGDLHGNMVAVKAVASHIAAQHIDAIYCLGDLVGKGPRSPETMDWALANCEVVLQGNWDELVYCKAPNWYSAQLGEARLRTLRALPFEHRFTFAGRKIRLLHGRPIVSDVVYCTAPEDKRLELFATADAYAPDVVAYADIHRPFWQPIDNVGILLNTGSVGNPLGGNPVASYAILEGDMGGTFGPLLYTFVQLPYDRDEAIRQAEAADGLPKPEAFINEIRTGHYSR